MADRTSKGRGWHGDSAGHARAGSQSHKNDGTRSMDENQQNSDQQL